MQIAPGIDARDWKKLDLDKPSEWESAIWIFERRIRGRFTDAVDFLIADDQSRSPIERRWGFTVLAVDCLLVETLEAFRQGLSDTRNRSKELCVRFLTERSAFKHFFSADLAKRFYYEFRCGLAHNAQVFGTGRIWSVGPLVVLEGDRITVNRTAFHQALLTELSEYVAELRNRCCARDSAQKWISLRERASPRDRMRARAPSRLRIDARGCKSPLLDVTVS